MQVPQHVPQRRALIARWLPLTGALDSLDRSVSTADGHPFTLTTPLIDTL